MEALAQQAVLYLEDQSRRAQDNTMLYKCLFDSLTQAGRQKILVWKDKYTVATSTNPKLKCGILLLKVIIRESHIDTNATTTSIRNKLSGLDTYISTVGHDITKFNAYVQMLIKSLETRGEKTHDLLANLFKGYAACSDKVFVQYIAGKEENMRKVRTRILRSSCYWPTPSSGH